MRIFRHLLDDEDILDNLRETCKRFNYIINYKLLTIDDDQFPVLEPRQLDADGDRMYAFSEDNLTYCLNCREIETKARYKFRKYKCLILSILEPCCINTVTNESEGLQTITELILRGG